MAKMKYDLREVLAFLDPALLTYTEWVQVGMALKEDGYAVSDWIAWSRRDPRRFHEGECEAKWKSFSGTAKPITGGTVIKMARRHGWCSPPSATNTSGSQELIAYLNALFSPDEIVGYVSESFKKGGRFIPAGRGSYTLTVRQMLERIQACEGDLRRSFPRTHPEAGAWIRFNPLDGNGVCDSNVVDFRFALVESDSIDPAAQKQLIEELRLPVAALVHSGNKSLHAIVKIEASTYDEYRSRVDFLYSSCEQHGFAIDRQNANPSRLSRMPGIPRGTKTQHLLTLEAGLSSWDEWHSWIARKIKRYFAYGSYGVTGSMLQEPNSGTALTKPCGTPYLSTLELLSETWGDLPSLAPPLIEGVLRKGHKMLLAGPSKAGKSFALIELAIAIAEGKPWFGKTCTKGRVLYINLELDRASCLHRFKDVYRALGLVPHHQDDISLWHLRGQAKPMDELADELISHIDCNVFDAIIIDPIYKVISGDENNADHIAAFCNQLDAVCSRLGCSIIYCHHHSKGNQGQKKSMDRASGSGVFARDADALLDMIELRLPSYSLRECEGARLRSAWRIEGTLREFPPFKPLNLWFDYPIHLIDETATLDELGAEGDEISARAKGTEASKQRFAKERKEKQALVDATINQLEESKIPPTRQNVANAIGAYHGRPVTKQTIRDWMKNWHEYSIDEAHGYAIVKIPSQEGVKD